jgi:hypothetical protein
MGNRIGPDIETDNWMNIACIKFILKTTYSFENERLITYCGSSQKEKLKNQIKIDSFTRKITLAVRKE